MAPKIKYDVSETEEFEGYAGPTPKRGIYECKVRSSEFRESANGHPMWETVLVIDTKDKEQKQYNGCPLWQYTVIGDMSEEWMKRNMKAILKAFGKPEKGSLDPEAFAKFMVDKKVRVVVKNENSDEYGLQAKANGLLPLKTAEAPEAEDEEEEPEEAEEDGETEDDEEDEEETTVEEDIADLNRAGLKQYIKDNELDVKVVKSMSDDDIRTAIVEAWPDEDDEEDEEDEEEGEEDGEPPF